MTLASARLALAAFVLAGCAQMPTGPTVTVLPGPYKPFEVFMQDDQMCRGWAAHSIGMPGHDAAANAFAGSVAVGATLGALAGAAAGGDRGAGSGAAMGTLFGAMVGSEHGNASSWQAQRRYDNAYQQCMYAQGNQIPGVVNRAPQLAPPQR